MENLRKIFKFYDYSSVIAITKFVVNGKKYMYLGGSDDRQLFQYVTQDRLKLRLFEATKTEVQLHSMKRLQKN